MNDQQNPFVSSQMTSYVDSYSPPTDSPASVPAPTPPMNDPFVVQSAAPATPVGMPKGNDSVAPEASLVGQKLEEQNIFAMLGVADGTEDQKEAFLDELQQVIWEDFLEHDVELLIAAEEYVKLQEMLKARPTVDLEQQEKIVVFLEKLIPDLEEIMLEKALQLKGDMFRERITGMRQFYAQDPGVLAQIDQAEQQMTAARWGAAADILNAIKK